MFVPALDMMLAIVRRTRAGMSPFSPIANHARFVLEVAEADFGGFRSLSATLCLAMTLAVGLAEKRRAGTGIPS